MPELTTFETRMMIAPVNQILQPKTFFRDRFFNVDPVVSETKFVDVDIIKGKRRVAPFVGTLIGSKTVERRGFESHTFEPPLIAPDMQTTAADAYNRMPGENIYNAKSPTERAAEQLGKDYAELDEMITRKEELMSVEACTTGKNIIKGEGVDRVIEYQMTNIENIPANSKINAADTKFLEYLKTKRRIILQKTGKNPDTLVFGMNAIDSFINSDTLAKLLDTRRIDLGQINPQIYTEMGVTYYGYLKELGCDIFCYEEWYYDEVEGAEKAIFNENSVFMGCSTAKTQKLYGAVEVADSNTDKLVYYAYPRVPDSWIQKKPPAQYVKLASRPLFTPTEIDAFYMMNEALA